MWYLDLSREVPSVWGATAYFTYVILFNIMIPISLYISMEMVKLFQALLINWDDQMMYETNGITTPAAARTSNLSEELGQITYIFSDKTGTLTCNQMDFLRCSVGGSMYGRGLTEVQLDHIRTSGKPLPENERPMSHITGTYQNPYRDDKFTFGDPELIANMQSPGHPNAARIYEFLTLLAVCHSVVPEVNAAGVVEYQASSPDEAALVFAAKNLGFYFHSRRQNIVTINVMGVQKSYEILALLEFTSTRKRMSVVVRCPAEDGADRVGPIKIFTKGADSIIYERLKQDPTSAEAEQMTITQTHLNDYAKIGLRTLCLASRTITPDEFRTWDAGHRAACAAIEKREELIAESAARIEKDLHLLGATAIEDKLQAGVPASIALLAKAGIKIWVLTGDKQETAIEIGKACLLLTPEQKAMVVNGTTHEAVARELKACLSENQANFKAKTGPPLALIIDGKALSFGLSNELKLDLLAVGQMCVAVICCRVSPLQKALVVRLVKDNIKSPRPITLAIGDGANDVGMIQSAHIGIGISGFEGMQAVLASDYALAQFRFLTDLLLVHGRWDYQRVSRLIVYCFYKNFVFAMSQAWFSFFSGFSGQTIFDGGGISVYNVFFTGLPILILGIMEQDLSRDLVKKFPQVYMTGQRNVDFNIPRFVRWVVHALFQSLFMYFVPYWAFQQLTQNGHVVGMWMFGTTVFTCVVITVNLKIALEQTHWTFFNHFATWGSIIVFFIAFFVIGGLDAPGSGVHTEMYNVMPTLFGLSEFWLSIILAPTAALLPDFVYKFTKRQWLGPSAIDVLQEHERLGCALLDPARGTSNIIGMKPF
jgi:phospholipid-transporting ATPase